MTTEEDAIPSSECQSRAVESEANKLIDHVPNGRAQHRQAAASSALVQFVVFVTCMARKWSVPSECGQKHLPVPTELPTDCSQCLMNAQHYSVAVSSGSAAAADGTSRLICVNQFVH